MQLREKENNCKRCKSEFVGKRKHCDNCLRFFREYYKTVRKATAIQLNLCVACNKPKGRMKGLRCWDCSLVFTERAKVFNEVNKQRIKRRRVYGNTKT